MIDIGSVRTADWFIFSVAGCASMLCLAVALYAVPWTRTRRKLPAVQQFALYWKVRLLLTLLAAAWLLSQWLRMVSLWSPGSPWISSSPFGNYTPAHTLCRMYLCLSLGLFEPAFLLCCLLICRLGLSARPEPGLFPNAWVIVLCLLASLPLIVGQSIIAWISVFFPSTNWEGEPYSLPHYFLSPYLEGQATECRQLPPAADESSQARCALCTFPAGSIILAVLFSSIWCAAFSRVTGRLSQAVINRRMKMKLCFFRWSTLALVVTSVALRAATLSGTPFTWQFEGLWLAHFLTLLLLFCVVVTLLVVLPMHEAYNVDKMVVRSSDPANPETDQAQPGAKDTAGPQPQTQPPMPAPKPPILPTIASV